MSHLLQILFLLSLVVTAAKLAGAVATRIGQPAVFGELLVGLLLGPTLLDVLSWPVFTSVSSGATTQAAVPLLGLLNDLADVGVILLMLVAGLETDLDQMRKVGTAAFTGTSRWRRPSPRSRRSARRGRYGPHDSEALRPAHPDFERHEPRLTAGATA